MAEIGEEKHRLEILDWYHLTENIYKVEAKKGGASHFSYPYIFSTTLKLYDKLDVEQLTFLLLPHGGISDLSMTHHFFKSKKIAL